MGRIRSVSFGYRFHSVFTQAVAQEENPLASPIITDVAEVDIESQIANHNKKIDEPPKEPRKPRVEVHADTPVAGNEILANLKSENSICPEMARLMGVKIK